MRALFNWSTIAMLYGVTLFAACTSGERAGTSQMSDESTIIVPEIIDFNFHVKPILSDRCFTCHGPDENKRESEFAFHAKELAFMAFGKSQDKFAIVPGDPGASLLVERIFSEDPDDIMPPPESNLTLAQGEKEILKKWIEQGAEWKAHWAFIPPSKPELPKIQNTDWPKTDVDHFILGEIKANNLQPGEKATKEKLIRRASFDLTGLPPTLAEIDAFVQDTQPGAFERVIERYFEKEAYAERMTQEWMDISRYADTHGYQDDYERTMWPWRDWVIHAFQKNMPYDTFVMWQIAGDLMPEASLEQIIATGFNRNHKITFEGGTIDEEYRVEYVADRTQTFGTAFLGLTMECARCHDHKYDPISQQNYFELFGFFNNVPERGFYEPYGITPEPFITLTDQEIRATASYIKNLDSMPEIELMVMKETPEPRQAYILERGQYDKHGAEVSANVPEWIMPLTLGKTKDRLALAEWLFDEKHPLTSRVAVNRLWQQLFGSGIVKTAFDFGNQGALPTHPELLDFLALKFIEMDWDVQAMLKYLMLSATYQQSSDVTEQLLTSDPENMLYARAPRLRLKAEMIRDQVLAISGLLTTIVGGPSVKPYQPEGIWEETTGGGGGTTASYKQDSGEKLYRRSLYTFWKRTVPPPSMMTFDAPSKDLCTVVREETNTPLQALVLMNDPQIIEAARVLAASTIDKGENVRERISHMFKLATSRMPEPGELDILEQYYNEEHQNFKAKPENARAYLAVGEYQLETELADTELAAYTLVANAIFNLDEAISRG